MTRSSLAVLMLFLLLLTGGVWSAWLLMEPGGGDVAAPSASGAGGGTAVQEPSPLVVERRTVPELAGTAEGPGQGQEPQEPGGEAGLGDPPTPDTTWLEQVRLTGRVRAEGAPVNGARILLRPVARGAGAVGVEAEPSSRVTGANGTFEFTRLPATRVELQVEAKGYGWLVQEVQLRPEDVPARDVTVELRRAQAIAGRVVDAAGEPVAGAEVQASLARGDLLCAQEGRTSADGYFLLDHLVPGRYQVLASAEGFLPWRRVGVEAGQQDLQIVLGVMARISGQAVDARTGTPLPSFTLFLARPLEGMPPQRMPFTQGRTFTDGAFEWDGLEAGTWVLEVEAPERARSWSRPFTLGEGQALEGLVVEVGRGGEVTGVVQGPAGAVLASVDVYLSGAPLRDGPMADQQRALDEARGDLRRVRTDVRGAFRFERAPAGRHHLLVRHPDYVDVRVASVTVQEGGATHLGTLVLEAGATLEGVARDGRGRVLPGATVQAMSRDAGSARATTDARGAYRLAGLAPGTWQVGILQYASTGDETVQDKMARAQASMVTVELAPGQTLAQDLQLGGG